MSNQDWQGPDAEAGALLEALGCDTGRGEHEDVAAALRRAHEAGARAMQETAARRCDPHGGGVALADQLAREIRALPLPSPEEPGR